MKNPFKKIIGIFKKGNAILIQKKDGRYYVCDGYVIVNVDEVTYRFFFAPEDARFGLIDSDAGCLESRNKELPHQADYHIYDMWMRTSRDNTNYADRTEIMLDATTKGNKQDPIRLYKAMTGQIIGTAGHYDDAMADAIGRDAVIRCSEKNPEKSPLLCRQKNSDAGMIILPVNCWDKINKAKEIFEPDADAPLKAAI